MVACHVGDTFDADATNNCCYMISYNDHWSLCSHPDALLKKVKNGGTYKYCDDCLRIIRVNAHGPLTCCQSSAPKPKKISPCNVDLCCGTAFLS